jgi:hypothetical protein
MGNNDTIESFAEKWLTVKSPNENYIGEMGGCIGMVAPTRRTQSINNNILYSLMISAIWPPNQQIVPIYKMGNVLSQAKFDNNDWKEEISDGVLYHYFGDPTMEIWTAPPTQFTNVSVSENGSDVIVNANVSGSKICIISAEDGGQSYFNLKPDISSHTFSNVVKPYNVTVTKHNYIPKMINPDIYIQNHTYNDDDYYYLYCNNCYSGSNVTQSKTQGPVLVKNGSILVFEADNDVTLEDGFEVELGGIFEVK